MKDFFISNDLSWTKEVFDFSPFQDQGVGKLFITIILTYSNYYQQ